MCSFLILFPKFQVNFLCRNSGGVAVNGGDSGVSCRSSSNGSGIGHSFSSGVGHISSSNGSGVGHRSSNGSGVGRRRSNVVVMVVVVVV